MPIEDHPICVRPENPSQRIWKYLDFTKFISLIENEELYFSSLKTLAEIDPFEGSLGKRNIDARNIPYEVFKKYDQKNKFRSEEAYNTLQEASPGIGRIQKNLRDRIYVNCWHINEYESAAMWSIYSKNNNGIAISTTVNALAESLSETDKVLHLGKINYIDHHNSFIHNGNLMAPALHKGKSFEHEKEIRLIYTDLKESSQTAKHSVTIKVNLEKLIQEIYISPTAEKWFAKLMQKVVTRYQIKKPIYVSDLLNQPYF